MNKSLFFIWSICLMAIVPLLAGCDNDDEIGEKLIVVERFEGTDGMKGEKILFEMIDLPAIVLQSDLFEEYVLIGIEETWNYRKDMPSLIGVPKGKLDIKNFPNKTKIQVSLSITNVERIADRTNLMEDYSLYPIRKAYLRDIKESINH